MIVRTRDIKRLQKKNNFLNISGLVSCVNSQQLQYHAINLCRASQVNSKIEEEGGQEAPFIAEDLLGTDGYRAREREFSSRIQTLTGCLCSSMWF